MALLSDLEGVIFFMLILFLLFVYMSMHHKEKFTGKCNKGCRKIPSDGYCGTEYECEGEKCRWTCANPTENKVKGHCMFDWTDDHEYDCYGCGCIPPKMKKSDLKGN